jgi:hypothetical protein
MDIRHFMNLVAEGAFDDENAYEYGSAKSAAEYASHVWYHGTEEDITTFDPSKSRFGGTWFCENPNLTGYYGPSQYKVRLHFKNPLIVSEETYIAHKPNGPSYWARQAKSAGHDAVIIQDVIDGDTESTVCCVFDSSIVEIVDKDLYIEEEARLPLAKGSLSSTKGFYAAMVVVMNPRDFIRLSTPADEVSQIYSDKFASNVADYKSGVDDRFNKNNYGMPFLDVEYPSGKVLSHEGRHRAAMIAKEGGTKFPCVIKFVESRKYVLSYNRAPLDDDGNFDWDHEERLEQTFPTYKAAQKFWENLKKTQSDHEQQLAFWHSGEKIETFGGGTMKGSPRSQGWDRDAWKHTDIPKQLIGQFDPSVVIPTSNMKHGLVKGYTHYK